MEQVVPILEADSDIFASSKWKNTIKSIVSQVQNSSSIQSLIVSRLKSIENQSFHNKSSHKLSSNSKMMS